MPANCPPVLELHGLACTPSADPKAGPLLRHLEDCPRCKEIFQAFRIEAPAKEEKAANADLDVSATWQGGVRPAVRKPESKRPLGAELPRDPVAAPLVQVPADSTQELVALLAPPQAPDEVGRLGPYRLLRALGSGATGVVFLAEDVQLGRQVALKVMKPTAEGSDHRQQRFAREARAAAALDHDHIVTIYQVGEDRGLPWLAMKLLQGETLDGKLKRDKQLFIHEVLRIGREIAEGLEAAHERGLVHRDIKPANIFLEGEQGRVKIVDFGLARPVSEDLQLTRTGAILGTPAYMSPEQARGARVDYRSDLFSLGCVLYRLCSGRVPFQADDAMGLLMALAQDQAPPLKAFNPDVPGELVGLINRLLAKVPEARPQSARAVADLLELIASRAAVARVSVHGQWPPGQREFPLWLTLFLMGTLGVIGWAGFQYAPTVSRWGNAWIDKVANKTRERSDR